MTELLQFRLIFLFNLIHKKKYFILKMTKGVMRLGSVTCV